MPHYTTIRGHTWLSLGTRISLSQILDPSNPTTSKRASVYTYTQRSGPSSYDRGNPTLLPESLSFDRSDFNRMDQPTAKYFACGCANTNAETEAEGCIMKDSVSSIVPSESLSMSSKSHICFFSLWSGCEG